MSIDNSPLIPVMQMGYVEKIVDVVQNHSDTQQHIANAMVAKELEKKSEQVLATEKSSDTASISVNKDGQKERELPEQKNNKKQKLLAKKEENVDSSLHPAEAFAGNLLNIKI